MSEIWIPTVVVCYWYIIGFFHAFSYSGVYFRHSIQNLPPPPHSINHIMSWLVKKIIHFYKSDLYTGALETVNIVFHSLYIVALSLTQLCLTAKYSFICC